MSVTKQTTTVKAAAAIIYAHFGKPADFERSRAAGWRSDFASPYHAITSIESMLQGTGRKNQALMIMQSFSADELDPDDPRTPSIVADAAYALAKEVAPNSPCDVVVHLDSDGGHPHAHVTIANVDLVTGKAARDGGLPHWILKQANDKVMRRLGLQVLEPAALAHDVNRSRSRESAAELSVDELDKNTWREFLADRVDDALQDPRAVDFDALCRVASEHGVSIKKKQSAKDAASGRDPSVTFALVDENGGVRRFGRSKAACTARRLGADYNWDSLHNTMSQLRQREQEIEDVKSLEENGGELDAALAELRIVGEREAAPRSRRAADEAHQARRQPRERVEIDDPGLGDVAVRLARERRQRDQEDDELAKLRAERDRRYRERQASREAARRRDCLVGRAAGAFNDEEPQSSAGSDDFEFG